VLSKAFVKTFDKVWFFLFFLSGTHLALRTWTLWESLLWKVCALSVLLFHYASVFIDLNFLLGFSSNTFNKWLDCQLLVNEIFSDQRTCQALILKCMML